MMLLGRRERGGRVRYVRGAFVFCQYDSRVGGGGPGGKVAMWAFVVGDSLEFIVVRGVGRRCVGGLSSVRLSGGDTRSRSYVFTITAVGVVVKVVIPMVATW